MTGKETLPFVVEGGSTDVEQFLRKEREEIRQALHRNGAVLLRGFEVGGIEGFDAVVRLVSGEPLAYSERSSPRTRISGRIYTSTDYPAAEEIFLHNENSYQAVWPRALYFYCVQPALTRGATPLADVRRVHGLIDPSVREEFVRRKWMAVRNYHPGFGIPWEEAFGTADRAEVAAYCARHGIDAEWRGGGGLRTAAVREPVHRHPETGAEVWFNHATVFHVSTLKPEYRDALTEMFGPADLPSNSYYGDGGAIPDDVVSHLRDCYRAATVRFDYRRDDLLIVDNMLTAHGREPFTGPRRIAVAMAEPSRPA